MLMSPLAPPRPSITSESAEASTSGPIPRQGGNPAEDALPAAQAAGDLERGADREDREQRGHRDHAGEHGVDELEAGADLRIGEQVMEADRHREHEQQQERDAAHLVAVKPPSRRLRQQHVQRDVGGNQPEVHDRVQRPREQHAREAGIDRRGPAEERWAGSGRGSPRRRRATSRPRAARRRWSRTSRAEPAGPDGRASSARSARP